MKRPRIPRTLLAAMAALALSAPAAYTAPAVAPPLLPPVPGARRIAPPPVPAATASPQPVHIEADYMRYDKKNKKAFAKGNVVIIQEDTTIYCAEVEYDQDANISYVNVPLKTVQLEKDTRRQTTLTGARATAYHEQKRIVIQGQVNMDRAGTGEPPDRSPTTKKNRKNKLEKAVKKERSIITADQLEYFTKKKDATFTGSVLMIQRDKKAWADRLVSVDKDKTTTLTGHVKLLQIKGDWLVDEGIVDTKERDEERDKALKNPVEITAEQIVINQDTNDAVATGNVHVDQVVEGKRRTSDSERADYFDKTQQLVLSGNVRLNRDGEWLKAQRIVMHTDNDIYEAFAQPGARVTSSFKVKEK